MPAESPLTAFLETDKRTMFIFICVSTLLLLFVKKSFIENETAAFEFLANRPEGSMLAIRSALQYFSIPLIYAWKFLVLAFVIWVGCFMFGFRVTYEQCWRVVMASELVFYFPELIKIAWFTVIETDPDFYRIQAFYPLSLMSFFNHLTLPARYHYPLKALNLFEIAYMATLMLGVWHFSKRPFKNAFIIIMTTYLPIFILWLIFYIIVYA
jgi:hypothetical protein